MGRTKYDTQCELVRQLRKFAATEKNQQPNWNSVSPSPISIYIILLNIFIGFIVTLPSLYLSSTHPLTLLSRLVKRIDFWLHDGNIVAKMRTTRKMYSHESNVGNAVIWIKTCWS